MSANLEHIHPLEQKERYKDSVIDYYSNSVTGDANLREALSEMSPQQHKYLIECCRAGDTNEAGYLVIKHLENYFDDVQEFLKS